MKKTIRACTGDDAGLLCKTGPETCEDTFREMSSPETMEKFLAEAFDREKLLSGLKNPGSRFYFLNADGAPAGYLKINEAPAQTDSSDPEGLEIERVYVRERFEGKGWGRKLLSFALTRSSERQRSCAWPGFWGRNAIAVAFYEHLGFETAGKHAFRMGDELQSDYIMKKSLGGKGG